MLWISFLSPVKALLYQIIGLLPKLNVAPVGLVSFFMFLRKGLYFFDMDVFKNVTTIFFFFLGAQMTWAIIEWIYKKIPLLGLD